MQRAKRSLEAGQDHLCDIALLSAATVGGADLNADWQANIPLMGESRAGQHLPPPAARMAAAADSRQQTAAAAAAAATATAAAAPAAHQLGDQ